MTIPFFRLQRSNEELANVAEVLDSGWLTTGKWAQKLEALFVEYCGTKHALAVNSCTAALHLAVEALGIGPGDKVIVPSMTFTASAEIIRYVGADPIFVDINPETLLIDPKIVKRIIECSPNVKAVVAVHFGGQSVHLDGPEGLLEVCKRAGIYVIQDAAHAFPAYDSYGPVGSVGDVTCFSFYANKTITSGEGGMLVTNNEEIAARAKKMRLHGIDRDVWDRFTDSSSKASSWLYDVTAPGFKYNMPDLNAAVGVAQFEKAWTLRDARQAIALAYREAFVKLPGVRLIGSRVKDAWHAHHLFPIVLTAQAKLHRDDFIEAMAERGIGTSVHYRPLHQMTYYQETYGLVSEDFPHTEDYWRGCVSLPIYPAMDSSDVDEVISVVAELLA